MGEKEGGGGRDMVPTTMRIIGVNVVQVVCIVVNCIINFSYCGLLMINLNKLNILSPDPYTSLSAQLS